MNKRELEAAFAALEDLEVHHIDGGWCPIGDRDPSAIDPRYLRIKPTAEVGDAITLSNGQKYEWSADAWSKLGKSITLSNGSDFRFLAAGDCNFGIKHIAHALAKLCRFGGHCSHFYSVAQHSVLVSNLVPPGYQMEALLHDAAEAFVGDMTTPLKQMLPEYKRIERLVDADIRRKFGLPDVESLQVKNADTVAFVTERRDLMPSLTKADEYEHVPRCDSVVVPLTPVQSYHYFMARYERLVKVNKNR